MAKKQPAVLMRLVILMVSSEITSYDIKEAALQQCADVHAEHYAVFSGKDAQL